MPNYVSIHDGREAETETGSSKDKPRIGMQRAQTRRFKGKHNIRHIRKVKRG